ncbi:Tr-type G domain-containing protein [Haematococcus lacustris]|uniref:Tr-type G domain-containing protein n=1 Tax=Haematococcus lacustris TaxID=44745 RepID=A0A699Z480_HAELA|nr:Tr-type G domain-containing protein [Haematococcus lacustris]
MGVITMATDGKQHLSIVICGHVDSGKSTTTGRLIFELGGIPERELAKLKEEADRLGKSSFAFAFYMDTQKEERARGVTISCTTKEFYTDKYHYTIIDAPGHRDFIKNMISGAAQADVCLLMVPADGNFTTAIQKGDHKAGEIQVSGLRSLLNNATVSLFNKATVSKPLHHAAKAQPIAHLSMPQGQTRQHARLINLLGVKQLIIGVNKMDSDTAGYKEARYKEIADEMKHMLVSAGCSCITGFIPTAEMYVVQLSLQSAVSCVTVALLLRLLQVKVGWKDSFVEKSVPIIPISGWIGDNLIKKSENMTWYTGRDVECGQGKIHVHTLLDALNNMATVPERKVAAPLRLPISGAYKIKGVGDVLAGRVEQGEVKPNDEVIFLPTHTTANPCFGKVSHSGGSVSGRVFCEPACSLLLSSPCWGPTDEAAVLVGACDWARLGSGAVCVDGCVCKCSGQQGCSSAGPQFNARELPPVVSQMSQACAGYCNCVARFFKPLPGVHAWANITLRSCGRNKTAYQRLGLSVLA